MLIRDDDLGDGWGGLVVDPGAKVVVGSENMAGEEDERIHVREKKTCQVNEYARRLACALYWLAIRVWAGLVILICIMSGSSLVTRTLVYLPGLAHVHNLPYSFAVELQKKKQRKKQLNKDGLCTGTNYTIARFKSRLEKDAQVEQ
jgi:hypothetical protein